MEWYVWALGGCLTLLQLIIGQILVRLWMQIDHNTREVTETRVDVAKNYTPRADHQATRNELRDGIHELRNMILNNKDVK